MVLKVTAVGCLALLLVSLGLRTWERNRDWRDDVTLFTAAAAAQPRSAKVHANLATSLTEHSRLLGGCLA